MADLSRFNPVSAAPDADVIPMEIAKMKREIRELQQNLWQGFGEHWRIGPNAAGQLVAVHYPSGTETVLAVP